MTSPSQARDPRIDFFRGLALVMIFINHIPDTVLGLYTSRNFGFSDAAEAFVLLSGISAGLAYSPVRYAHRQETAWWRPWRRAFTLWWVQALIVLAIYLMLWLALPLQGVAEMAAARNVTPVLEDPGALLVPVLLLAHQFNCADILPLYIILLIAAPAMIALAWRWPRALIFGSGLLWLIVGWNEINVRTWPQNHSWFFNPLSWQFLFVIGLVIGLAGSRGRKPPQARVYTILPTVVFLVLSALWMQNPTIAERGQDLLLRISDNLGTPSFLTSFNKTFLAPLRLLHVLALAYVLWAWPFVWRIAQTRLAAPLTILGRNALPAFAAASVLAYLAQILREHLVASFVLDTLLIAVGLNIMLIVALLRNRQRFRPRPTGSMLSG